MIWGWLFEDKIPVALECFNLESRENPDMIVSCLTSPLLPLHAVFCNTFLSLSFKNVVYEGGARSYKLFWNPKQCRFQLKACKNIEIMVCIFLCCMGTQLCLLSLTSDNKSFLIFTAQCWALEVTQYFHFIG
jgi:hypothetical protein